VKRSLACATGVLFFWLMAIPVAAAAEDGFARAGGTAGFLDFRGFRIKPPPGENWVQVERDHTRAFFGKRTGALTHTFVALVFTEILPDSVGIDSLAGFFEFIRGLSRARIIPGRHWFLEEEFATEGTPAPTCIRHRLKVLDTGSVHAPHIPLLLVLTGLSCAHPQSLRTTIHVHYEERGGPEPASEQLQREGEEFINGIVFTPLE